MSTRKSVLALTVIASLAAPAAFATSGFSFVGGELGYEAHPMPSTTTRAQVRQELEKFRRNPVTSDGLRFVGGELGWIADAEQSLPTSKTREQVKEEFRAFMMHPVSADGWRYVGGELGWVLDMPATGARGRIARVAK